jgi:hypothetical protein
MQAFSPGKSLAWRAPHASVTIPSAVSVTGVDVSYSRDASVVLYVSASGAVGSGSWIVQLVDYTPLTGTASGDLVVGPTLVTSPSAYLAGH